MRQVKPNYPGQNCPEDVKTENTLTDLKLTCSDNSTKRNRITVSTKKKKEIRTIYSTDVEGDVQEAEICASSLNNTCEFNNCRKLHAKCPQQWQFKVGVKWYNFRDFHSKELETAYKDPRNDRVKLSKINPERLDERHVEIANLLTTKELTADFEQETVESDSIQYKIRRLTTNSSETTENKLATGWDWYFEDKQGVWINYGQVNSLNTIDCIPKITSQEIEEKFAKYKSSFFHFSNSAGLNYALDFAKMVQINKNSMKVRKLKRRPHFTPTFDLKALSAIPKHWTKMRPDFISEQIHLDENDKEYKEIAQLVTETLSVRNFQSIKRNQNPVLWSSYINGKCKMMMNNKLSESDLNEIKLFHGTSVANIDAILDGNLDWRLHGQKAGQRYGRGTYFAKLASYSNRYAPVDNKGWKHLLVCRVLVGRYTIGDRNMVIPPLNPWNNNCMYDTTVNNVNDPSIFVKYDSQEYYPEYLVTYRT